MGIEYLGILVAAVAAFAVGMLWYGPLFGKKWQELMHVDFSMQHSRGSMTKSMAGSFIATLIMTFVLAIFEGALDVGTIFGAVVLALWLWVGFVATIMSNMMWYERKPWKLYLINAIHYLLAMIVAAIVLVLW